MNRARLQILALMGLGLFGGLALSSCGRINRYPAGPVALRPSPAPPVQGRAAGAAPEEFVVVGRLENRARVITVKTGPEGVVYSVADKNGAVLYENLSAEELEAHAPQTHDLIKTGTATWAGMTGKVPAAIWAGRNK